MCHLGQLIGITIQTETLIVILLGITASAVDTSIFKFKSYLDEVWKTPLDVSVFSVSRQKRLKYILSGIILIRTFTLHIFLAMYIVMLWPAIFEDKPNLILPWLFIGFVRNILLNIITTLLGFYICIAAQGINPICLDFIASQIIDHGPGVYGWILILCFYMELTDLQLERDSDTKPDLAERRRKARYYTKFREKADDGRNLMSQSTIDGVLNQLQRKLTRSTSRSLDALLTLQAAEDDQEEIMGYNIEYYEDLDDKPIPERVKNVFNLTEAEINSAKYYKGQKSQGIISEFTLDAIAYDDVNDRLTQTKTTVSSDSFFVKNGKIYKKRSLGIKIKDDNTISSLKSGENGSYNSYSISTANGNENNIDEEEFADVTFN